LNNRRVIGRRARKATEQMYTPDRIQMNRYTIPNGDTSLDGKNCLKRRVRRENKVDTGRCESFHNANRIHGDTIQQTKRRRHVITSNPAGIRQTRTAWDAGTIHQYGLSSSNLNSKLHIQILWLWNLDRSSL
jgi:hypothetical protein